MGVHERHSGKDAILVSNEGAFEAHSLTLGQAARENALARLYLSVNWRAALIGSSAVDALSPSLGR